MGIVAFASLVKGSFVLRRMARSGRQNYSAVLLKSPMVPPVSTIAVPPDSSAESVLFARRLLELHFGRNEVVIVLDGPSQSELAVWSNEFKLCPSARAVIGKLPTAGDPRRLRIARPHPRGGDRQGRRAARWMRGMPR